MTLVLHGSNGITYPNGDTQIGAAKVLQIKRDTYTTQSTFTTGFPDDDTVPQNNEGDEIFSIAMTAANANNLLRFTISVGDWLGSTTGPGLALFNGASSAIWATRYNGYLKGFVFELVAGTTDAKTYTVHVGDSSTNAVTVNISTKFGPGTPGQETMSMTIEEIEV